MALDPKDLKKALRETVVEKAAELGEHALKKLTRQASQSAEPQTPLGEPAFTSSHAWSHEIKAKNLVILCSDARFLPHCQEFLANALKLTDYDLVAVPGGVQWLALPDVMPKHHKVAQWVASFLIKHHHLERVICIAHEDCGAYQDSESLASLSRLVTGKSIQEHQLEHLRRVGAELAEGFGVAVELYYAATDQERVVFHKVE